MLEVPNKWKLLGKPYLAQRRPAKVSKIVGAGCPRFYLHLGWILLPSFFPFILSLTSI